MAEPQISLHAFAVVVIDQVFHIILHIHVSGGGPCATDMDGAFGPIRRNDSIAKVSWFSALNGRFFYVVCSPDRYQWMENFQVQHVWVGAIRWNRWSVAAIHVGTGAKFGNIDYVIRAWLT